MQLQLKSPPPLNLPLRSLLPLSLPLPPLLNRSGRIFVGREDEWRRLMRFWDDAGAGRLRAVIVAGEPGVGKSRLAAEFARRSCPWPHLRVLSRRPS